MTFSQWTTSWKHPKEVNKVAMTSAQFTEQSTSKTVVVDGMKVHCHDVGSGYPGVMLHSYGPGTTGWITFHKMLPALAEHFRYIVMDLPNFGRTGPVVYEEPLHNLQARTALAPIHRRDEFGGVLKG